jgi:RNA polymerase sigma-70 factor (ECF subfamily)
MGRHAADRPGRPPLHSDLFSPTPGSAAERYALARSAAAFETLVEPHREDLAAYVRRLTGGDEVAARGVLKETYYRAAQDPARYPQRASAVRPWLVLTARTVLRDGERLAPAGHDDRPPVDVPERAPRSATTIVAAMEDLASSHRDILVELFYRGVSLEDAATTRGVPVEELKSRLYFAMRSLRVVLDQQLADRHDPDDDYRR